MTATDARSGEGAGGDELGDATWFDPVALPDPSDPAEVFDRLRAVGPVARIGRGLVGVVGYDAATAVLRDPATFASGPIGVGYQHALPEGAARDELAHRINFLDPPDHPRVRSTVNRLFTPRQVRDLRPWVEALADELLAPYGPGDEIDLLAAYAHRVPTATISELLGMPDGERDQLAEWTEAVTPLLGFGVDPATKATALAAADAFHAYVADVFAARRAAPADDLITRVVTSDDLTEPEQRSLVTTLYSAGHRTTRDLTANGLATILGQTGTYEWLAADRTRVPAAVVELLRHATPTTFVARVSTADAVVDGVTLPAGNGVAVLLAAANRDPAVYEAPHELRLDREGTPDPLSFVVGPHHCLGASLARMETEVMLDRLLARFDRLTSVGDPPAWHQTGPFRGVDALRVRLG